MRRRKKKGKGRKEAVKRKKGKEGGSKEGKWGGREEGRVDVVVPVYNPRTQESETGGWPV